VVNPTLLVEVDSTLVSTLFSLYLLLKVVASCISNEATTLEDGLEASERDKVHQIETVQSLNEAREIKDVGWKTLA